MTRTPIILSAVALVALGSTTTYLIMKRSTVVPITAVDPVKPDLAQRPTPLSDISVTLSKEAVERAGIVVGTASVASAAAQLHIPAMVEPNAYRAVIVTPIAAGRVISVSAELGQQVRRGQPLAQTYSPELAEAQSTYLASRSELEAHERDLRRTEKLAEIGSASRQELERIHAEHTAATSMVQSRRSRLALLGMTNAQIDRLSSASDISAAVAIPAPIDGVITARTANIGLNVDPATPLFTVVDLSEVWLVGELYERDVARVRVGNSAMVTTSAYPELLLQGKVSYIDQAVNPQTRTARVRVVVPNRDRLLRLGMYAEMNLRDESRKSMAKASTEQSVVVPREAVQMVGDRAVVYVADATQAGRFLEREVRLGAASGEDVVVISGLQAGDPVAVRGSFSLRAERERLGLRTAVAAAQPASPATQSTRITVSDTGFEPSRVSGRAGAALRLTFVRTSDATCATELVIPALKIERNLPLNQPVDIELTPQKSGDIEFMCGMNMFTGTIVVQ
jgi:RND family efflux transporter MFP subunit